MRCCYFFAIALTTYSLQASTISGDMEMGGMVMNFNPVGFVVSFVPGFVPTGNFGVNFGSTGDFLPLIGNTGNVGTFNAVPGPQPISNFIDIFNDPNLVFSLTSVSPGVFSSTDCTTGTPTAGQTCTPAGGTGNWTNTSATTATVSMTVLGTVADGSTVSFFTAVFNATFGEPFQSIFTGGVPVQATSSGSGSLTATPTSEPAAPILFSFGLLGIVLSRLRLHPRH
jgi:hypothetical protein